MSHRRQRDTSRSNLKESNEFSTHHPSRRHRRLGPRRDRSRGAAFLVRLGSDGFDQRAAGTDGFVQPASADTLTAQLAALGDHLEEQPKDAAGWALLAQGYVEQARMTADAGLYAKAEQAIDASLTQQPDDNAEAIAAGAALEFSPTQLSSGAPWLARAALQINPLSTVALAIRTDALTEPRPLSAGAQLRATDGPAPSGSARNNPAGLPGRAARRHLPQRRTIFRQAAHYSSGADRAFALVHLADLMRTSGNVGRAELLYREALRSSPDDVTASVGLARISRIERRTSARAVSLMRQVTAIGSTPGICHLPRRTPPCQLGNK